MNKKRCIAHVDMDAFFASIEERDDPSLRGRPIVVGADPRGGKGRGVVSTCSYEARKYGIHSAMPISEAYRACPHAVFLGVDMGKYAKASEQIYRILYSFSPDVEPISIDEAFLDIAGSAHLFGGPLETCRLIRERIRRYTGLTASIGLAPTKMAAKIASDICKPDGLLEVPEEGLLDFLRPLEVRKLWGLGPKSAEALEKIGVRTIGDLAARSPEELAAQFGKAGAEFWALANGIDERPVESAGEAKSIGNETTFDADTDEPRMVGSTLMALCEKVSSRLRSSGLKCRTVTLKVRLADFSTFTRSDTAEAATNFIELIYSRVTALYKNFDTKGKKIRLLGVKATNFCPVGFPDSLFGDSGDVKREARHKALDKIKERFGDDAIFIAGGRAR